MILIYRVQHTYINLFHDDFHAIACSKHIYEFLEHDIAISWKNTYINLFHDDFHAISCSKD